MARMTITVAAPLPPSVPPQAVIDALHASYEPLIRPHPFLRRFERRRLSVSEVVDDPFFEADGAKLEAYEVVERVPILPVPGFHKDIVIPAVFQSFARGVRCRADTSGVRIWSVYEVRPLSAASGTGVGAGGADGGADGEAWELLETAKVECNALVKPFVQKNFITAHRDILKGTIAEIATMQGLPNGSGSGPVRVTT
ncbi:hypothetical protein RB597_008355 [Gaeumannomyces tritici]